MSEQRPATSTRRDLLRRAGAAAGAAAIGGLFPSCGARRRIAGTIVGASEARGHRLRGAQPPGPAPARDDAPIVIVGGGIAGLSAAWRLAGAGVQGVALLELEDSLGGTAMGGTVGGLSCPWGAHYVPRPTREQKALCRLLEEVGAIHGFDAKGRAIADEATLCRAPQERLFAAGEWHDGLFPRAVATADDLRQLEAFEAEVARAAAWRDDAGRRAFAIPVDGSSPATEWRALDGLSMAQWLDARGLVAPLLRWYVEYACRDDFGTTLDHTSAWAGLHYFASRVAAPGDEAAPFLTWPEGNGRLVRALAKRSNATVRTGCVASALTEQGDRVVVRWFDAVRGTAHETTAEHVVCALPRFVARRVVPALAAERDGFRTSPWVVANIALDEPPRSSGFPLAWDNVLLDSESLGYVDATHQLDRSARGTVWTWYRPFCGRDPARERESVLAATWETWRDRVIADLARAHERFESNVERIDVMRWGHAMVRPEPGFLWGDARRRAREPVGRVHFAAADLGGLPLFEEAQAAGVRAAEEILSARGVAAESWL